MKGWADADFANCHELLWTGLFATIRAIRVKIFLSVIRVHLC